MFKITQMIIVCLYYFNLNSTILGFAIIIKMVTDRRKNQENFFFENPLT